MLGIGCFVIEKLGCGWCCGVFQEKNWVGLGVGVSNCKVNWVCVVVGGCGQLKLGLGLGLGVFVHGLIGLGLWLGVPKPHFAHPSSLNKILLSSANASPSTLVLKKIIFINIKRPQHKF